MIEVINGVIILKLITVIVSIILFFMWIFALKATIDMEKRQRAILSKLQDVDYNNKKLLNSINKNLENILKSVSNNNK